MTLTELTTESQRAATIAATRVPQVSGLRIARSTSQGGTNIYTLVWRNPEDVSIAHFNVYAQNLLNQNQVPSLQAQMKSSPAEVRVLADESANVIFKVQTVLTNGMSSDLDTAPTAPATTSTFAPIAGMQLSSFANDVITAHATPGLANLYTYGPLLESGTLQYMRLALVNVGTYLGVGAATDHITFIVRITVDEATPVDIQMWQQDAVPGTPNYRFLDEIKCMRTANTGDGSVVGDDVSVMINLPYTRSLRVDVYGNHALGTGVNSWSTFPTMRFMLQRAIQTA
jgi:hypothetical protein